MTASPTDPVLLTQRLIQCPSVTPEEGGALALLEDMLSAAGFACTRVDRAGTPNLFARWGSKNARTLGFNGHTDVVPVGDETAWTVDPFGGEIRDGLLWGRGATDMKSGVAAWVAAAIDFVADAPDNAALVITITGDEEGDATDGTVALLDWMQAEGEVMTDCIVGEPTCPNEMGEMMKIGRRGSMTAYFTAKGVQGHAAYPHRAKNPVPALARLIADLDAHVLDHGTDHFDASTLAVTTMDVGNPATNVIPAEARATVNIRFNDAHSSDMLSQWLHQEASRIAADTGIEIELQIKVSGESFVTPPGALSDLVADAVETETGRRPEFSTSGGTSDARFVKNHCPVVEFGLVGKTMHQVDERVELVQIQQLKAIYKALMHKYFATS
ncbi:Succinyl-diaminopimelate desuccinylase [Aliiroseovarius sp. xm-m-379]|uniref:succinyl-diaminopimelate desuccinylase n=1 Tax=unclassified Aliiroseovarius TaxID=2623558 RepID=UPI001568D0E2|nr:MULTISPECIES: succinyl-diaminopimelate desuccinylase [unclassified Aliiroseovarius]NRP13642.1 Succinyl-diaminopimelate desuccinylase [Aliiroseovarius sp. xm-d-517]NRP24986.1 Succinyl-diaminopimelate desuccinylase [Aliiroseovarius sp. xm-m-379]NRP31493.1 Succinyl-diaminopimelate desuccinylase [Aliiroseovarius sp. xm-m-314]NRP33785.1 Succinyl-diaminopimelate desuccinylase [Aliiroseovarius sp. xm-a-104]NRP41218.1 Succinyl-diaminopimelate desuccinylase [Aliiroseovarius sp. xm-m-339-2]